MGDSSTIVKTLQVRLRRDSSTIASPRSRLRPHQTNPDEGFGFVVRCSGGGVSSLSRKPPASRRRRGESQINSSSSRPLTVVSVRVNGAADREGSLRVGDRILAVNSVGLVGASLQDFQRLLDKLRSEDCVVLIEYDVAKLESVLGAEGPILIEMEKDDGRSDLGIALGTERGDLGEMRVSSRGGGFGGVGGGRGCSGAAESVIKVEAIKPASTAERTGALSVGDSILSIDGVSLKNCSLSEAQRLLVVSDGRPLRLEVLPVGVKRRREERAADERDRLREEDPRRVERDDHSKRGYADRYCEANERRDERLEYSHPLPPPPPIEASYPLPPPIESSYPYPPPPDDAAQQQLEILSRLTQSLSSQIQVEPLTAALQSLGVVAALKSGESLLNSQHRGSGMASAHSTPTLANRGRHGENANHNNNNSYNTLRRLQRYREQKTGSCGGNSIFSSGQSLNMSGQVCRTERVTIELLQYVNEIKDHAFDGGCGRFDGFLGFEIKPPSSENPTKMLLRESPLISYIEPEGPAEKSGVMQVGDRLLEINGFSLFDKSLEQARGLLREAARLSGGGGGGRGSGREDEGCCVLEIEFDVIDAVVPTQGVFVASLVKRGVRGLGITISASTASSKETVPDAAAAASDAPRDSPHFIVSAIKLGSVAHRSGVLDPGDQLLAIDGLRLDDASLEEAAHLLKTSEDVVKLTVKKDRTYAEDDDEDTFCFAVELRRRGKALGLTIVGSDEVYRPVFIKRVVEGGLTADCGLARVGDQILSIDGVSLRGKGLEEARKLLRNSGDSITFRIKRRKGGEAVMKVLNEADMAEYEDEYAAGTTGEGMNALLKRRTASLGREKPNGDLCRGSKSDSLPRRKMQSRSPGRTIEETQSGRSLKQQQQQQQWEQQQREQQQCGQQQRQPQKKKKKHPSCQRGPDLNNTTSDEEWPIGEDMPTEDGVRSSGDGDTNPDEASGSGSMMQSSRTKTSPTTTTSSASARLPMPDNFLSEIDASLDTASSLGAKDGIDRQRSRMTTKKKHLDHHRKLHALEDEVDSFDSPVEKSRKQFNRDASLGSFGKDSQNIKIRHPRGHVNHNAGPPPSRPPLMSKVVLRKEVDDNFGFSIADGLFESGVYIKRVRRQGPADVAGVKRFDKILLVNGLSAKDAIVEQLLPLFDACERALELTICRYDPLVELRGVEGGGRRVDEEKEEKNPDVRKEEGMKSRKKEIVTEKDEKEEEEEDDSDTDVKVAMNEKIARERIESDEDMTGLLGDLRIE